MSIILRRIRRFRRRSIHLALAVALCTVSAAAAQPGEVKQTLPSPCNYPSGLAWDGTSFYVADWREGKVFRVDPADGTVRDERKAPTLKPRGLAYGMGKLFVSDDRSGGIFAWNFDTGIAEWNFQAPGNRAAGLAYAKNTLYVLEQSSKRIYKVIPEDGTILADIPVPDKACESIAFDGRYLWVADRTKDELYMLHPETGTVLGVVAAPGPYAAGLAWVDGYLWNADFQNRKLYQLVIDAPKPYRTFDTRTARVEYYWALNNYGPGVVSDIVLNVALPENLPNQELLSEPAFSTPPTQRAKDKWGQPCAVFELESAGPGEKAVVDYSIRAKVSAIRYLIIPEKTGKLGDIPKEIRQKYLGDGARYRVSSPYIQQTVKEIVGDEKNPYWIMRKIYNFVIEKLEYEMVGGWDVPEVVLNRGKGSCSEYTFSFVALCRAAGLPARYQGSVVVRGDDASIDEAFHRWAQVYLPNYGWVPVDASRGDSESLVGQAKGIGELANRFLITTHSGGDSEYLSWGYNSNARFKTDGYCKVEEDNLGFWEPVEGEEQTVQESR
jgi:transglutaminase-like putative cysteine protease